MCDGVTGLAGSCTSTSARRERNRSCAPYRLTVLKISVRAPQANAFCERVIGTLRLECLDFMIPMSERHVRAILREWVHHYNRGRPHASLGA
jgi:transposase InsO family protein